MQLSIPWRRGQKKPWGSIPRINRGHRIPKGHWLREMIRHD